MRTGTWVPVGLVLAVLALAQPGLAFLVEQTWAAGLLAMMVAELFTGREAAIPFAAGAGVPPFWIALTSILQNLALAALVVPTAAAVMQNVEGRPGRWGRFLRELHGGAKKQVHQGRSAGALFAFMLVPFLANGAVIAGLIGVLAGLQRTRLVAVIVSGVAITSLAWAFAYHLLARSLESVHPLLAWLPTALAVGFALAWFLTALVSSREPA